MKLTIEDRKALKLAMDDIERMAGLDDSATQGSRRHRLRARALKWLAKLLDEKT